MARGNSWSGVSSESTCQAYTNKGIWTFEHNEKPLSDMLQQELNQFLMKIGGRSEETIIVDFVIPWTSSGYYDAGSMYGGSDNLGSPPEGDDDRNLAGLVHFEMGDGGKSSFSGELSEAASNDLFGWVLEDIIRDQEIDTDSYNDGSDYDEPDYYESYFEKRLDAVLNEKSDGSVRLSDDSDFNDEEDEDEDEDDDEDEDEDSGMQESYSEKKLALSEKRHGWVQQPDENHDFDRFADDDHDFDDDIQPEDEKDEDEEEEDKDFFNRKSGLDRF